MRDFKDWDNKTVRALPTQFHQLLYQTHHQLPNRLLSSFFSPFANLQWKSQQAKRTEDGHDILALYTSRVSLIPLPGLFSKQMLFFTLIVTSWSSYILSSPHVYRLNIILLLSFGVTLQRL